MGHTGDAYDDAIAQMRAPDGRSTEAPFFALAVDDLQHAADLFLPASRGQRQAWTAGCRWRCRRCWSATRAGTIQAALQPACAGRASREPVHQDPGYA